MNCLLLHKAQDLSYRHVSLPELLSSRNVIRNTRVRMILSRAPKIKIGKKMFKFSKTLRHQAFEWSQARFSSCRLKT